MYPQEEIDGFERYWRRRKPGRSTAVHYRSDVNIFFCWAKQVPAAITMHHIDQFIDWQHELELDHLRRLLLVSGLGLLLGAMALEVRTRLSFWVVILLGLVGMASLSRAVAYLRIEGD